MPAHPDSPSRRPGRPVWASAGEHVTAAAACAKAAAVPWALVLAFLLAVPVTGVWVGGDAHDFARVVEIVVCLGCAVGAAFERPLAAMSRPKMALAGASLALALASTVSAPIARMAWRELLLPFGLFSVAWVVAARTRAAGPTALFATVSMAGAGYGALTLFGLAANLSVATALRPFDLLLGYDNGRFFNHVQTSMLPLLALATLHPFAHRNFTRLAVFGLAIGLALLVLTEGRATALALVVALAVGSLLFPRTAWPLVRSVARAGALAAVLYALFFAALPRLAGVPIEVLHADGVADSGSAHSRFILWHIALDGIRRSPWLGIGPMHFSHTWNSDAAHPHNVYLQVAEEWGLPMATLLLCIAFVAVRTLYRAVRDHRGDEADRRVGLGLFATVIAIGVDGMLSGNFVMPVSQVWIAVVAGAAIGWVRRTAPRKGQRPAANRLESIAGRVLRLLPLAAMLGLAVSIAPELGTHFLDRHAPGTATDAGAPRFWSNGWF